MQTQPFCLFKELIYAIHGQTRYGVGRILHKYCLCYSGMFQKMSSNEVTHKLHTFLHYVWNYPFARVPKIAIHMKTFVLGYFLIKNVDL